ncbi:MAG: hypothetical protein RJA70_1225 [Pseudomonadota bacterium]|jgi:hypothetical protein
MRDCAEIGDGIIRRVSMEGQPWRGPIVAPLLRRTGGPQCDPVSTERLQQTRAPMISTTVR